MPQLTQVRCQYEVSSKEEKKRTGSVLHGKEFKHVIKKVEHLQNIYKW